MLTRLLVKGFKNLVDTEVAFGPFTCIAGANGVGKSNLFDAIMFLRDLTEYTIVEAAARVRDPLNKTGDLRAIFHQTTLSELPHVYFEVDFVVPKSVLDDFGRKAEASITFLRYTLELKYVPHQNSGSNIPESPERIELLREELTYIQKSQARRVLGFKSSPPFRAGVIHGERRSPFISTENNNGVAEISLHQDGGSRGQPFKVLAASSPRTILGGTNTNAHPTVLAARREMQSWMLLQLEPSALRQPDTFAAESKVGPNGAHLPATLLRLNAAESVTNRLAELIPEVKTVAVDKDEARRLNTLTMTQRNGATHPARALSDGTLRFLALSIINADPDAGRLICLEEPENGIHPSRIPVILELLQEIAVDPESSVGQEDFDNPFRQVIINTHSPSVVSSLPADSLVLASTLKQAGVATTEFCCVEGTWRAKREGVENIRSMQTIPQAALLSYLTEYPVAANHNVQKLSSPGQRPTVRQQAEQFGLFDSLK